MAIIVEANDGSFNNGTGVDDYHGGK